MLVEGHFYRLPIQHPEYRYPASKNPYWLKLQEFRNLVFSDHETELHAGDWRTQFQNFEAQTHSNLPEVHVEIGCNAGHVIVEWATDRPDCLFIGIDWKFKSIFRAAQKASTRHLKNLIFFRAHAERLESMFGPGEIDSLSLFFPDPWPKKKQWKNRFIQGPHLEQISRLLKPDGTFHIKTDHPEYFEWILEIVQAHAHLFEITELSRNLHADHPAPDLLQIPEVTLFEKLFIKKRLPIHSLKLKVVSLKSCL